MLNLKFRKGPLATAFASIFYKPRILNRVSSCHVAPHERHDSLTDDGAKGANYILIIISVKDVRKHMGNERPFLPLDPPPLERLLVKRALSHVTRTRGLRKRRVCVSRLFQTENAGQIAAPYRWPMIVNIQEAAPATPCTLCLVVGLIETEPLLPRFLSLSDPTCYAVSDQSLAGRKKFSLLVRNCANRFFRCSLSLCLGAIYEYISQ